MKTQNFECTLVSDIILCEHAATEGIQRTLDYIPGNVFLGIVAGKLYENIDPLLAMNLFHNAKVRFGDAFPIVDGKRAIKIPALWYVRKGDTIKDQIYIYHRMPDNGLIINEKLHPTTQLRDKFIIKEDNYQFSEFKPEKNFAIKSAYDREKRRSMDQQMYGYQSLEAGMKLCFQVDFDDTIDNSTIKEVITILTESSHTVGRSRTAQYGQVKINVLNEEEEELEKGFDELELLEPNNTFLYAESRLIFIDEENGQPIIPMEGIYYGFNGGSVNLRQSQIRTFRYAPYNSKRKSRDADRFGIEKGSVICINREITREEIEAIKKGIGLFLNEGFGKVLINPEFLKSSERTDIGEAIYKIKLKAEDSLTEKISPSQIKVPESLNENAIFSYLIRSLKAEEQKQAIYSKVNNFVEDNKSLFKNSNEQFASQWSTIRTKAMQKETKQDLFDALFSTDGYLMTGQSSIKWKNAQKQNLKEFLVNLEESIALKTMINLSAEMAKKCKKGGNQ